ncbi:hypothetical protein ACEZDF_17045 [Vibrio alginolyticus]|uniref:hypothetical protein n=1 Tax=Vibrio alginolyticus TaxID=663 RepID=UPI0035BFEE35
MYLSVNCSGENYINRLHRNFPSLPYTRNQHSSERIDVGINKLQNYPESFQASFLEVKSDIHKALGLDDYIELLEAGVKKTDSPKYASQLEEKILSLTNQ